MICKSLRFKNVRRSLEKENRDGRAEVSRPVHNCRPLVSCHKTQANTFYVTR